MRDDEEETMENWDVQKLAEVVEKKHGEAEKKMPTTDIVRYLFHLLIFNTFNTFSVAGNGR